MIVDLEARSDPVNQRVGCLTLSPDGCRWLPMDVLRQARLAVSQRFPRTVRPGRNVQLETDPVHPKMIRHHRCKLAVPLQTASESSLQWIPDTGRDSTRNLEDRYTARYATL